uniref:Defensin-like protein n=1 Tax=Angiostrongylus cantonensis TaxID=6313 RepID=A0A0K0D1A6_ANGCA
MVFTLHIHIHKMNCAIFTFLLTLETANAQGAYYPNHWYGANSDNVLSGKVPKWGSPPILNAGTLAPHVCGFNPFIRKCMDPENHCPGRCMNFRYTYNTLYDCRCLVVNK